MKKILTKVFVLTAAAIVLAGTVPQGVNAQANRHHCKRKMVTARHASCYQNGYCNLNGSCDVNGVCQNGGYCFGAHCSQNGICDQTNCPLGTDCPNYLGGNYNVSGTASGTVSPSVTPQEDNNANNAPAVDTAPVASPQTGNSADNAPAADTAPVASPQADDNNSEDVYPVEEVSPVAPPQETVISPDPVVYPDNNYSNGYCPNVPCDQDGYCDTPGSCWNGTDYNDYTHHPEGNNNGWSGHHSGRGHGSHH